MDKYEYDQDADAFSLRRKKYDYAYSIEVTSELILDIDSKKNLVAIEMLDASKVLNVAKDLLMNPHKIFAQIITDEEGISLTMNFEFKDFTREIATPISEVIINDNALMISV
ncbi:MAG: DUF2283 domain-containing protein [Methanosphaera sp.]|nr:DUF2283 domain-containing protein [Methanosphaera sp.]